MKAAGQLAAETKLRSSKYPNNLIEQDHRGVMLRVGPMLGFQRFRPRRNYPRRGAEPAGHHPCRHCYDLYREVSAMCSCCVRPRAVCRLPCSATRLVVGIVSEAHPLSFTAL